MRIVLTLASLLMLIGCARDAGGGKKTDDPGPNISRDGDDGTGKKEDSFAADIAAMKPVDPVSHEKLLALLPKAPAGYEGDEPDGKNIEFGPHKHSYAERTYRKDDARVEVKIHDFAQHPELYAGFSVGMMVNITSPKEYHKSVTIDGQPGFEKYNKADNRGELVMLVAKRHVVIVNVQGAPAEMLRTAYNSIDRKALAALK